MNQPTYNSDGFATVHSVAWMEEPRSAQGLVIKPHR